MKSLSVRRAIDGEIVLSMSSEEMHGQTVAELRQKNYIVIKADWADVDLLLSDHAIHFTKES